MLPPGGEGEVKVTLTPKGNHEDILKRIIVVSDDPAQPRFALTMKGKLLVDVRAEPGSLNFSNLEPGAAATLEFDVELRDAEGLAFESVRVEDEANFELRELEAAGPGKRRYELKFRGRDEVGSVGSRVEVRTTSPNTPQLNVPIRATIVSNLRYSKRVHFGTREGGFAARQIRITARDGVAPELGELEDPAGLLILERREQSGAAAIIDARVDEAKLGALAEAERDKLHSLIIHTNDPDEPRVEISYSVRANPVRARANPP